MKTLEIKAALRGELGKKDAKAVRKSDSVPGVLYGGTETVHFQTTNSELRHLVYSPEIFLVNLDIDGKTTKAILKDIQFHPVKDTILHVDFYEVNEKKPIVIDVPVKLEGLAEGVKAGGKLSLEMRKIRVKGLYSDVPENLVINVENLGLGKTIQIGALSFDKLEIQNPKEAVVVAVKLTRAARGAAAAAKK
ncbi:MAG: 50S ribosomal protein L25/general stress protein Ctc [Prevotellaceae bacterium]|jgi:large subunit ribosomal protein L25|nr:50S ribosomal protein L25/general stress protein Ctc [Prevotellaceae bacterium]